jgi:pimeloyl-ACP methyl ester carboxylesterase
MRNQIPMFVCVLVASLNFLSSAVCQIPALPRQPGGIHPENFNIPTKTMGGQQFWTDVSFVGGWHIQRNLVTEHFRLLDPNDVRHAWGTWKQCDDVLATAMQRGEIRPYRGRLVILLHGLNRTHASMDRLAQKLKSENGFEVINFQYASSRGTIHDHARDLGRVIDGLGSEVQEIHFVAHSMGNLVVRNYLHQRQNFAEGHRPDPRLGRMVMLGPPNQGSCLARRLKDNLVFQAVAGVGGQELSQHWNSVAPDLAVPHFPFAIIAGGGETSHWYERVVFDGPSDLIVAVHETRLPNASLHLQLPVTHTFMMEDQQVMKLTAQFLTDKVVE